MSRLVHSATLCTFAAGGMFVFAVEAIDQPRSFVQNATGACQAALPAFEGQIRQRPLALQNEGTASAFVTCALMGTDRGVGDERSIGTVFLYADNNTDFVVNLTCTLVDGWSGGSVSYLTKTRSLPANSKAHGLAWYAADNGDLKFNTASISCNVPVGVGLTRTATYYREDIGA